MKGLLGLLAAGMLLAASVGISIAAPIYWDGNGHSYTLVNNPGLTWEEAQTDLQMQMGKGWHLATITSQEEQDWLFNNVILPQAAGVEYWLGGLQDPSEMDPNSGWSWMTGETWSYTNFVPTEPNDYNGPGSEQYLAMWSSGFWNDAGNVDAWYLSGYIGESGAPVPEPGTLVLVGVGLAAVFLLRRRNHSRI